MTDRAAARARSGGSRTPGGQLAGVGQAADPGGEQPVQRAVGGRPAAEQVGEGLRADRGRAGSTSVLIGTVMTVPMMPGWGTVLIYFLVIFLGACAIVAAGLVRDRRRAQRRPSGGRAGQRARSGRDASDGNPVIFATVRNPSGTPVLTALRGSPWMRARGRSSGGSPSGCRGGRRAAGSGPAPTRPSAWFRRAGRRSSPVPVARAGAPLRAHRRRRAAGRPPAGVPAAAGGGRHLPRQRRGARAAPIVGALPACERRGPGNHNGRVTTTTGAAGGAAGPEPDTGVHRPPHRTAAARQRRTSPSAGSVTWSSGRSRAASRRARSDSSWRCGGGRSSSPSAGSGRCPPKARSCSAAPSTSTRSPSAPGRSWRAASTAAAPPSAPSPTWPSRSASWRATAGR